MDFISSIVFSLLPSSVTSNIYFALAVVVLYAVASEILPLVQGTKYNGVLHMILDVTGVWKAKLPQPNPGHTVASSDAAVVNGTKPQPVISDPLNADKK